MTLKGAVRAFQSDGTTLCPDCGGDGGDMNLYIYKIQRPV